LYGIGQGSCASPLIWALLNQLLLTSMGEMFDCIQLVGIDGTMPGDSFVDVTTTGDTNDNVTSESVDASEQELTEEEEQQVATMEEIVQLFLDCVQVTGGARAPPNCA
jgi:hypothetical protein